MPIYSTRRLSRATGVSLSLSMSAADEIGKSQKDSAIKSQELQNKVDFGVPVCCSKGDGVIRSLICNKSRPRSVSPPKNRISYDWEEFSSIEIEERSDSKNEKNEALARKQRSSRWHLRNLLYRSRSEGSIQRKEREGLLVKHKSKALRAEDELGAGKGKARSPCPPPIAKVRSHPASPNQSKSLLTKNGGARSSHELYYQTNRAQAEELKRRSFLPYRQALLGCMVPFPSTTSNHNTVQPVFI